MLINTARTFYERTASLRANRTTSYLVGLAAIALTMLGRFLFAKELIGFPFLTFFPAISLGPIVEQLSHGKFF